jgi:hypothetical protein
LICACLSFLYCIGEGGATWMPDKLAGSCYFWKDGYS